MNSEKTDDIPTNTQLVTFLKNLTNSLENNKLADHQLQNVGEFYMSYEFKNKLFEINKHELDLDDSDNSQDFDSQDVMKFITMGWWVYSNIVKDIE